MGFDFGSVDARDYDELRPAYAPEAVTWVADRAGLRPGSTVVDLAAGTGRLARAFAERGAHVLAVEPADNMRALLDANAPEVESLAGTAEHMPVEDAVADAVVVGNAFHHFDTERAFGEIRRVLRRGGTLALFWTRADRDEPAMISIAGAIDQVVERVGGSSTIADAYRSWFEPTTSDGFTAFERRTFPVTHVIASNRVADLVATSSHVASLPAETRVELLGRIDRLARDLPATLELKERSEVHLCVRT